MNGRNSGGNSVVCVTLCCAGGAGCPPPPNCRNSVISLIVPDPPIDFRSRASNVFT